MKLRDPKGRWSGLKSVVRIEPTRRHGDAVSTEARSYLSSLPADGPPSHPHDPRSLGH